MVSYLSLERQVRQSSSKSECYCSRCGDEIEYGTPAWEILVGHIGHNGFELALVDGDFEFEPIYYHDECWAMTDEETSLLLQDDMPVVSDSAFLTCSMCGWGIELDDKLSRAQPGMIVRSAYAPNGEQADDFEAHAAGNNHRVLCLSCREATEVVNGNEDGDDEEE